MGRDDLQIIEAAERVMRELSEHCDGLHRIASPDSNDRIALIGIHDESKLYRMRVDGKDNGWALDLKVKANVKCLSDNGMEYGRSLTIYHIAEGLCSSDVADRLLGTLKEDVPTDSETLGHLIGSQIEVELNDCKYGNEDIA